MGNGWVVVQGSGCWGNGWTVMDWLGDGWTVGNWLSNGWAVGNWLANGSENDALGNDWTVEHGLGQGYAVEDRALESWVVDCVVEAETRDGKSVKSQNVSACIHVLGSAGGKSGR